MRNLYKMTLLAAAALISALQSGAAAPDGYYASCEGKTGQALLKALYNVISDHTNVGYDGLWEVYKKSDVRSDGTLWDIYSTKAWSSNFTHCGNYKVLGDCVNREHSLPKSWWGGGKADQYSDAFHLYPTDGKVNGQRSNFAYGECASGTRVASNGSVQALGKLGNCTFAGFTGTVFEPDDQYKGDLARSYFYMATCYNSIVSGWTQGNGGDMLAGNSYPVFKTWALNLLLKWARQDAVSQKEIDRNEAIYGFQHNRNPFIDHPELIEYIWGDKVGQAWYGNAEVEPVILQPVQNSTINLGQAAVGLQRSIKVQVKADHLTKSLSLSTTGDFSVSPTTIPAAMANEGAEVTVSVLGSSAGDAEGQLLIRSEEVSRAVDLCAVIVDGMPLSVSDITDEGFTVGWVNLHSSDPSKTYSVHLYQGSQAVPGFPVNVKASQEKYVVTGLDAATDYQLTLGDVTGNIDVPILMVRTAAPIPSIVLYFDGTLHFDALPGEDSGVAELLMEAENIEGDITVSVDEPFKVSTDKSSWSTSVTLDPEEDRFYLMLSGTGAGSYESAITLTDGSYVNDDATVTATVAPHSDFLEDWEVDDRDLTAEVRTYSSTVFEGHACRWSVNNGGFGTGQQDKAVNGSMVLRFGNDTNSSLAMDEDKNGGIGTVTFDVAKWPGSDAEAVVAVEYSTDGGLSWLSAGNVTVSETAPQSVSMTVNVAGPARIRFLQTSGKRWFIDNIAISDYSAMGAVESLDYHSWDAYCQDGALVLESRDAERTLMVYSLDGISRFADTVSSVATLALPAGLYLVTDGNFTRRVLVK